MFGESLDVWQFYSMSNEQFYSMSNELFLACYGISFRSTVPKMLFSEMSKILLFHVSGNLHVLRKYLIYDAIYHVTYMMTSSVANIRFIEPLLV